MRCWIPGRHSVYPSGGFKGPVGSGSSAAAARRRLSPRVVLLSHVPSWLCCGWTPGLPGGLGAEPGGASAGRESGCWVSLFMFPGQELGRAPAVDKPDGSVTETTVTRAGTRWNRGSRPRRGPVLTSRPWGGEPGVSWSLRHLKHPSPTRPPPRLKQESAAEPGWPSGPVDPGSTTLLGLTACTSLRISLHASCGRMLSRTRPFF